MHYRIGERDGVSLEIEKRARTFKKLNTKVVLCAGVDGLKRKSTCIIPELDLKNPEITNIREIMFGDGKVSEQDLVQRYRELEEKIYKKFLALVKKEKPDLIFIHNLFSHAYNLPGTTAVIKALDELKTPVVALHHDFWFERERFSHSPYPFIQNILTELPPKRPYIKAHEVINSLAEKELLKRRSISAHCIADYFDYKTPYKPNPTREAAVRKKLGIGPNDVVILHATRIARRKAIENAIYFTSEFEKVLREEMPVHILARPFTTKNKVWLVLPNFVEAAESDYQAQLDMLAKRLHVNILWASDVLTSVDRKPKENEYSFWDSYPIADIVTYTSIWEGFGNQLLEAFYFKKLTVLFEYPVFLSDIQPEGYEYVSLGHTVEKKDQFFLVPKRVLTFAARATLAHLQDPVSLEALATRNYALAKKYHDDTLLAHNLTSYIR